MSMMTLTTRPGTTAGTTTAAPTRRAPGGFHRRRPNSIRLGRSPATPSSRSSGFLQPRCRKVIPEVLALWFRATAAASCGLTTSRGGRGGGFIGAFDEAVELVCGAAGAALEVLAELSGLQAGLRC